MYLGMHLFTYMYIYIHMYSYTDMSIHFHEEALDSYHKQKVPDFKLMI
jgi:hypothetical protein